MECPALLPAELKYCEACQTEAELVGKLVEHLNHLIKFFLNACKDETWSETHSIAMKQMLRWMTREFVFYRLPIAYTSKIIHTIQLHISILEPCLLFRSVLYYNVAFMIQGKPYWVNSFLFAASSPPLRTRMQKECWDKLKNKLELKIAREDFLLIKEFIYTGQVKALWKMEFEDVHRLMGEASFYGLAGLVNAAAAILKLYLDRDNVIDTLIRAHQEKAWEWKRECYEFFNRSNQGIKFLDKGKQALGVEFIDFKADTIDLYNRLAPWITHIAFRGELKEYATFNKIIHSSPHLIGVDVAGFKPFKDFLNYLPSQALDLASFDFSEDLPHQIMHRLPAEAADMLPENIYELDLSDCPWLEPIQLKFIFLFCRDLKKLRLSGNRYLNEEAWGQLNRLHQLRALDLSHCRQLSDEDLIIIAKACPFLEELVLHDCLKIADAGSIEIIHAGRYLTYLDLSYSGIGDKALHELSQRAGELRALRIEGCRGISEKGLMALSRGCPSLKYINACNIGLSENAVMKFQKSRPQVKLEV